MPDLLQSASDWLTGALKVNVSQTVSSTTITGYYQRPLAIDSAFVRINTNSNGIPIINGGLDYPVGVLNLEEYEMIGLKTLNGPWPKALYYQPTEILGNLYVWPNPSQGEMHVFANQIFATYLTLYDNIVLPQGYVNALRWCLAERLMPMYGKASATQIGMINAYASQAKATIKRINMKPVQDAFTSGAESVKGFFSGSGMNLNFTSLGIDKLKDNISGALSSLPFFQKPESQTQTKPAPQVTQGSQQLETVPFQAPPASPPPSSTPAAAPDIVYIGGNSSQQSAVVSGGDSSPTTDVPLISSSNPNNFYTLYSQVNYNVVI